MIAVSRQQGNPSIAEDAPFTFIQFFNQLGSYMLDSYLVMLIALDAVIQGNMVIKDQNLIESTHLAIIGMHNEGLIPSLQACLQVTLKNALHRFAELDICTLSTYLSDNGSRLYYVSGKIDKHLAAVRENLEMLIFWQNYQPQVIQKIESMVQVAIKQALVTHISPRL